VKEKPELLNNQNELEIHTVQEIFLSNIFKIKVVPMLFIFHYIRMKEHVRKYQK